MIERRRTLHLPAVVDTDPDAPQKLAELVADVVDGRLPGVGINHEAEPADVQEAVHAAHRDLFRQAVELVQPAVVANEAFDRPDKTPFAYGTPLHDDLGDHLTPRDRMKMIIRLHTTDANNTSKVLLANSYSGLAWEVGDENLYRRGRFLTDYARTTGYDGQDRMFQDDLLGKIYQGGYDPLATSPDVYRHFQQPLGSVAFRSMTSLGPATAHGFEPFEPEVPRTILTSDLNLYTQ